LFFSKGETGQVVLIHQHGKPIDSASATWKGGMREGKSMTKGGRVDWIGLDWIFFSYHKFSSVVFDPFTSLDSSTVRTSTIIILETHFSAPLLFVPYWTWAVLYVVLPRCLPFLIPV